MTRALWPDSRTRVLSAAFPYESKYVEILGSKMHYIDQGQDDVFLFLHGNPTSSYLWRNVMRYVAPHGRIVAVDNIGFGKSDKPDVDHTFQTHFRYMEAFIDTLELRNIILVGHDWGSALGLYYAARRADNVKGVVFMEPITPPAFPIASASRRSFLFAFRYGVTNCGAIKRASCPCARKRRAQSWAPPTGFHANERGGQLCDKRHHLRAIEPFVHYNRAVGICANEVKHLFGKINTEYAQRLCHGTRLLLVNDCIRLREIILAHRSRSAQGAGPFH
jgi:pimeloyl-ACP methyl ester carboxylesterase